MSTETALKMEWVNSLPKMAFMDEPQIREAFIRSNMSTRGASRGAAEMFAEKEAMYLKRVIYASTSQGEKADLRQCTTFSLYACYMDMSINGDVLSFNPDDKLTYIEKRGYKVGQNEQGDVWEQRARMTISPYGELAIRQDYGQIKYADPAIVVLDGDFWELETDARGSVIVRWKSKIIGRTSKKIIGAFVRLTRPDDSIVFGYMLQEDIDRLVKYSLKANKGKFANALYGAGENGEGIDAGFLKAKVLKHSFKNFPKVKLKGNQSQFEEAPVMDIPDEQDEETSFDRLVSGPAAPSFVPQARQESQYQGGQENWGQGEDFTPPQTSSAGVKVNRPAEEDTF